MDGKRYPIISLDTQRHQVEKELSQLETELLKRPHFADDAKLRTYLEAFITHHEIEMPSLKMSNGEPDQPPPEHYQHYAQQWKREYDKKILNEESLEQDIHSTTSKDAKALKTPEETSRNFLPTTDES